MTWTKVESAILKVSRGLSHKSAFESHPGAHQNCGERVECSLAIGIDRIYGAFSLENVLKSVSDDFHGQVGRKKAF